MCLKANDKKWNKTFFKKLKLKQKQKRIKVSNSKKQPHFKVFAVTLDLCTAFHRSTLTERGIGSLRLKNTTGGTLG